MSNIELIQKAIELVEAKRRFALASVIRAVGSTPQKAGANAIFAEDGQMWGTLGGGCLEAECRRRAMDALDESAPLLFDLKLDDISGWDDGLICGGQVRVFVDPRPEKNRSTYRQLVEGYQEGRSGSLMTRVGGQCDSLGHTAYHPGHELADPNLTEVYPALRELLERGIAGSVRAPAGNGDELYFEPYFSRPKLIIAGAGHIGRATAHLGHLMGFDVTVIDDRPALARAANLPDADQTICGEIAEELEKLETDSNSYVVIVTRGHRHDGTVLAAAVKKPAAFIGMIGSRRKGLMIRQGLVEQGVATEADLERVCSPIGLDIGSVTVQEIALSIVTQLVSVRRRRQWGAPAMSYGLENHRNRPRGRSVAADGTAETVAPVER